MSLSLYPMVLVSNYILSKDKNIPFAIIQLIFVMMPTLGYVDQLVNMIKTCKFHIFKIDLFLIVFSASILKVVYWFLSPYSSTLFFQFPILFSIVAASAGISPSPVGPTFSK